MDGMINVRVNGYSIVKDHNCAGAQFEVNSVKLRIEFSEDWTKFTKTVTFWNALGEKPVQVSLGEDLLEDKDKNTRVYLVPIPGEAMTEAGMFSFAIDGYDEGVRKRTVEDTLKVLPSRNVGEPQDPTPTLAEQLMKTITYTKAELQTEITDTEVGLKLSPTGAEAFNDYKNNDSNIPYAHVEGRNNNVTVKTFLITGYTTNTVTLDSVSGIEVGMPWHIFTIENGEQERYDGYILGISNRTVTVTGDSIPNSLNPSTTPSFLGTFLVNGGSVGIHEITDTAGDFASHTEGRENWGGLDAHAEGTNTKAYGWSSHAEGRKTSAIGEISHAEGYNGTARGVGSHVEGATCQANGGYSHAEGYYTEANERYSHSEGQSAKANGDSSHAEGYLTTAGGTYAHAEGDTTIASGESSHSEGSHTEASGRRSHSEGSGTKAQGEYSHAEGDDTTASGECAHAEGKGTLANGQYSHAEGQGTTASGVCAHAEGYDTTASGNYAHAEGNDSKAYGVSSHAEGYRTTADGGYSHAEGSGSKATAPYSHAEGYLSEASGEGSHAEGYSTEAKGNYSHAEGYNTTASTYAHAEGNTTTASGEGSHAEGNHTVASGKHSHSEGSGTQAQGVRSHAEGDDTIAFGECAHAEGAKTEANGQYSHAEGQGTIANSKHQHVQGKYNVVDDNNVYAHIVGNGSASMPSNAHTLDWDGNGWFAGTVEATAIILKSSTAGSSKRFKITVDDSGNLHTAEI